MRIHAKPKRVNLIHVYVCMDNEGGVLVAIRLRRTADIRQGRREKPRYTTAAVAGQSSGPSLQNPFGTSMAGTYKVTHSIHHGVETRRWSTTDATPSDMGAIQSHDGVGNSAFGTI